mgnify:CR=1 FL=1
MTPAPDPLVPGWLVRSAAVGWRAGAVAGVVIVGAAFGSAVPLSLLAAFLPVLAGQSVQQAGLADVGTPEQGHPVRPAHDGRSIELLGHCREQRIEQLPGSSAMERRDGERLTQAKAPQ